MSVLDFLFDQIHEDAASYRDWTYAVSDPLTIVVFFSESKGVCKVEFLPDLRV